MTNTRKLDLWMLLHLPAAALVFQLVLDLLDPAQTDKWLELPVLVGVGLGCGWLLRRWLRRGNLLRLLKPAAPKFFPLRVMFASALWLWACLTVSWGLVYLAEFMMGFGVADTPRMLLLMPLIVAFYWPEVFVLGVTCGLVTARLLRRELEGGQANGNSTAA